MENPRPDDPMTSLDAESTMQGSRCCIACGEGFDPRYSRDGEHCFTCSVHVVCACADPAD